MAWIGAAATGLIHRVDQSRGRVDQSPGSGLIHARLGQSRGGRFVTSKSTGDPTVAGTAVLLLSSSIQKSMTPNPNKRVGIYVKSGKARRRRPAGGEENLAVSSGFRRDFRIPAAALGCSPATHPLTRTYSEAAS